VISGQTDRSLIVLLTLGALCCSAGNPAVATPDRARWPAALQDVPLERLSSGALLRLDAAGDLVETPAARNSRTQSLETPRPAPDGIEAADPRVGNNVRLGDDPPALPSNQRAQAEPHIARSPVNPGYLIATFQEGRFAEGGSAINCGYSVSRDGGVSWTRALIPFLTPSSGGPYPRATDPVAAVGLNGHAYLNTLAAGSSTTGGTILVSRSTDGTNFAPPVVAFQAASPSDFPDKNWIAINNFPGTPTAGRIVVTFTMFPAVGPGPHPIMRVYSDDGGQSWSSAALVHAGTNQVQGSQPVFLSDGRLVVLYWNFNGSSTPADDFIEMVVSPDGGVTFGAPTMVTAVNTYNAPAIRDGAFLPSAVADRVGGIHLTYQALDQGVPRIMFMRSPNAGATWTPPAPISDNPAGSGVFNAAISASPDGRNLAVAFYDLRNNPGSTTLVDLYVAMSFNGGASWQPNVRVSSVSSNAALAPQTAGGYMLGDYQGIAEATNRSVPAVPVWIDTRTGDPDPFTARIAVRPPLAARTELTGDTQSDVIWQNNATGARAVWVMNGSTWVGERFLPPVPTEWQIATSGDFDNDGHTDLVWQNTNTGQRAIWLMNGTGYLGERFLPSVPLQWQIRAAGDFNADGHSDLLWQNTTTGQRAIWLMNGTTWIAERFLPSVPTEWQIVGADEFNADGRVDILWQNDITGQRAVWLMNGTTYGGERFLPPVHTQWQIAGTGEFNGDSHADIIWQNNVTGQRAIWLMNGTTWVAERFLPTIPLEWQIRNH
jgi:hypothetical protein